MKGDICANPGPERVRRGRGRERWHGSADEEGEDTVELVPFLLSTSSVFSLSRALMMESEGSWVAPANTTRVGFKG